MKEKVTHSGKHCVVWVNNIAYMLFELLSLSVLLFYYFFFFFFTHYFFITPSKAVFNRSIFVLHLCYYILYWVQSWKDIAP